MITSENVREVFHYCPESGKLHWRINRGGKIKAGMEAGSIVFDPCGLRYRQTSYKKKWYFVHRLVWLYVHGHWPDKIDHENGDGLDNRISNLRNVSNAVNQKNKRIYKTCATGISGVQASGKGWRSNISVSAKMIHLGSYSDFFEACCARKSAECKYGFHDNHGRQALV